MTGNGLIATAHITINGQSVAVEINRVGGAIEGAQSSEYFSRSGKLMPIAGYAGYASNRIHLASTRTIANAIERYINTSYPA